jgi:hypothetical protein
MGRAGSISELRPKVEKLPKIAGIKSVEAGHPGGSKATRIVQFCCKWIDCVAQALWSAPKPF